MGGLGSGSRSRALSRALSGWLVTALAVVSATAHAEPSSGEKEAARKLMIRGLDQRKSGALKEALESFRAANEIMHVPSTAVEVARTQRALGHWLDARDTAQAALRLPGRPNEPAPFKEARAEMSALVDDVNVRAPSVVIVLSGTPPGAVATVTLDGSELPSSALGEPRKVDPGHHVIDGKAGDSVGHVELDLPERQTQRAELVLRGPGSPLAPTEQPANVASGSGAIDPKKSDPLKTVEIIGFAAGGVGLLTGVVTGIISLEKTSSIRKTCGGDDCPVNVYDSLQSDRVLAHTTANVATAGFIVAGVGAAVGFTSLVLRAKHKKADPTQAGLIIGPGFVSGSF